ncbi:MAG: FixH family protein [Stappiaceae bacterium]
MQKDASKQTDGGFMSRPVTGRTVLAWFVGFFFVVFSANAVFIWLALDSWTGVEAESPYVVSQTYQEELEAARRQADLGWTVDVETDRPGGSVALIRVTAKANDAAPLTGFTASAALARPTRSAEDHQLELKEAQPGVYTGTIPDAAPGQWNLILELHQGETRVFRSKNKVYLKEGAGAGS